MTIRWISVNLNTRATVIDRANFELLLSTMEFPPNFSGNLPRTGWVNCHCMRSSVLMLVLICATRAWTDA
ncbi:MAG: hypothetical protein LH613_12040, partial [Chamaesiphon sp.]|nr:hypothetical protein [Chamaesiphon sp.]